MSNDAGPDESAVTSPSPSPDSGLRIAEVRIQDVRAITDMCLPLSELTVLVGENNVGKSTVLRALDLAIGRARPSVDDLHVPEVGERSPEFVVDLRLVPAGSGQDFEVPLAARFGDAVQLPASGPQFVTLRSRGKAGADGADPIVEHRFVGGWDCDRTAAAALPELERPSGDHLRLLSFFLLDARRDIVEELRQRHSYWGRLLADIGIEAADRAALETQLATLGADVVEKSSVLTTLRIELERVRDALGSAVSSVSIEAIPARVDEVVRAVDVLLKAPSSAALPLRVQGMGSRSLAVVMVFQAFTRLRLGSDQDIHPLSVAAFEEPEAHLHPHPQRAMFDVIRTMPGQNIVSTHSPYVTQVADLFELRALTRSAGGIACRLVSPERPDGSPTFDPDGLSQARRFVQRNNGEILFARCVILFEGETEFGALPVFARDRWGANPTVHGISLIDAQGAGNFKHFIAVLDALGIPWTILVDGDKAGMDAIAGVEAQLGRPTTSLEVFPIPNGEAFERNLITEGYQAQMKDAVARMHGADALADFRARLDGTKKRGGSIRDYQTSGWEDRLLEDFFLVRMKNALGGEAIATEIVETLAAGTSASLPSAMQSMFERVDSVIGLGP